MSTCKFCGTEIFWTKEGRRNVPLNPDSTTHTCDEMKNSLKSLKTMEPGTLSPDEIAKYELGINQRKKK